MHRITTLKADITTLNVGAIVNAANEGMLGGGGVDGAVHRAAGPELLEACQAASEVSPGVRCPTGEARITPGFRLPAKYVIHTVGPVWYGGQSGEEQFLASCYLSACELAVQHRVCSIAFPAISCGAFGYPVRRAAFVAMEQLSRFLLHDETLDQVVLVASSEQILGALNEARVRTRNCGTPAEDAGACGWKSS